MWSCQSDAINVISRIVEFAQPEEAQRAIKDLSELPLLGRPIFIREVRSRSSTNLRLFSTHFYRTVNWNLVLELRRFRVRLVWRWQIKPMVGSIVVGRFPETIPATNFTLAMLVYPFYRSTWANNLRNPQLPYQAGWQDLKDLFRAAGNIVRADINISPDGRAKGSGTVIFETAKDAQSAICMLSLVYRFIVASC